MPTKTSTPSTPRNWAECAEQIKAQTKKPRPSFTPSVRGAKESK